MFLVIFSFLFLQAALGTLTGMKIDLPRNFFQHLKQMTVVPKLFVTTSKPVRVRLVEADLALALGFVARLKLLEGVFGVNLQQVQLSCLCLYFLLQALLLGAGGTHNSHGQVFGFGASLFARGPPRVQRGGHLGFGVR